MKKVALGLLCGLSALQVHAESFCGYKDYFRLSDNAHPGIYIVGANADYDLDLQVIGPRSFQISDMPNCHSGYAQVTVAYDNFNWCVLDIKDGPYMNHPNVKASCSGLRYIDTTYDGFGSHSYTIYLD